MESNAGGKAEFRKGSAQTKLDGIFEEEKTLREFSQEGVLKAVARFVACDDQV